MKIIVVYATAGAGHKKAAQVIAGYIRQQNDGSHVELVDIVDRSSWLFRILYLRGYDFLVNHAQWLWSFLFSLTGRGAGSMFTSRVTTSVHYYNTRTFVRYLTAAQPDVVVSTHFLSSDIVSFLKKKGDLRSRLITVITDFGVHPYWIAAGTDTYCVASEITRKILAGEGVPEGVISVTGIPTDPRFSRSHDRQQICARLGLDSARKIVLVVTGSFGIGPIEEIAAALHDDYEVLAVCARNKRLYERLKSAEYPHTHIYGFIDFIDDLMAVADVIITKPGGLTISELLCMDLIPLFISAIPGQESVNADVLQNAGIGSTVTALTDIKSRVERCIREAPSIKAAIRTFKQPNAVSRIYEIIRTGSSGTAH
jgi:processive 1,2-diacylglycerol beta-glucosyltransferase